MARKPKSGDRKPRPRSSIASWVGRLVCLSVLLIPLVVSLSGRDSFRLPKELVFRAEMIILVALIATGLVVRELDWRSVQWRHPAIVLSLAIAAWTTVSAITSTNRELSVPALLHALGAIIVFAATAFVARTRGIDVLRWVAWAGIVNSALYLVVAMRIMKNPIALDAAFSGHSAATGLLGNANDVGSAILPIAICAVAAALSSREHRVLFIATAILAISTVLVSVSVAAIGALVVALGSLAFVWNWRRALVAVLLIAVAVAALSFVHGPLRYRVSRMAEAAGSARWDELASGRLTAFSAALEMFRDHPLTGVGPGTFGWQYYPYKLEVSERHPELMMVSAASRFNFEETHNDHLEVLAETGLPGYLLFAASLIFVGAGSLRRSKAGEGDDPRARFARLVQLPLAVGTAVIALAQYPLQLTSSLTTLLFLAAVSTAWRRDLEPLIVEEKADA